ncbi:MAG: IGHMBP2 family helicase [Chloroflexota bacterium]
MTKDQETHFQRLNRLMALEGEAEKEELLQDLYRRSPAEAEAAGSSLIHLIIVSEDIGLGGRTLLTLKKRHQGQPLPASRIRVGAPVVLSEEGLTHRSKGWRGVVSQSTRFTIQVAFSQWLEFETEQPFLRLDRSTDEIPRQRQRQAMDQAQLAKDTPLADLREVLLGHSPPRFQASVEYKPLNPALNSSQHNAVKFALTAKDLAIIHGPPGTGKTTTVVEFIRQVIRRGETVLACAPSNMAVDNLLEHLLEAGEKVIRLGHPARVRPELQGHTLDLLVEKHPDVRVAHKLVREAYALRTKASKYTRAKPEPGARRAMRQDAKQMLKDARHIEQQVKERLLDGANVLCVTTTGIDPHRLGERTFDWCIIDEAGQSTEPGAWVPLQYAKKLILAGDHCQLPPTVISQKAMEEGFNISLLERLVDQLGSDLARLLTTQYRMHEQIMAFSSQEFYEGSLVADESVADHLLQDLPDVTANELTSTPIHFIDTAGASYDEAVEKEGASRFNLEEAKLVISKVEELLATGISANDIAVITPYAAQVKLLREELKQPQIEIDSVDGFQGREKEVIILSFVRSNYDGEIGFLDDVRRTNVALTRARRKLIVIGDSATITSHSFYDRLVAYFDKIGAYRSVWEM